MFGGQGAVLVVAYILTAAFILSLFVIFYKLVHVSQAQSQSISFLDKFWESKRLDDIFKVSPRGSSTARWRRCSGPVTSSCRRSRRARRPRPGRCTRRWTASRTSSARWSGPGQRDDQAREPAAVPGDGRLGGPVRRSVRDGVGHHGRVHEDRRGRQGRPGDGVGPIAEALIATAVSLAAAIPSVVAYNYFNRRIKVLGAEMTTFGSDYLNIVKRHFF
jgi:biopolymer transport protein TolQ